MCVSLFCWDNNKSKLWARAMSVDVSERLIGTNDNWHDVLRSLSLRSTV